MIEWYKNMIVQSRADIINLIMDIEKKYPIHQWKKYGFCIWPLVRVSIYAKMWNKIGGNKNKTISIKKVNYLKLLKSVVFNSISIPSINAYAVFLNNAGCRREVDGVWIDVFTDPIRNLLSSSGYESIAYEWENTLYKSPCYKDSIHFQGSLNVRKIKAKLKARFKGVEFPYFDEINAMVNNVLSRNELSYQIELIRELYLFFKKIIKYHKPSIAFSTIYYNEISMAFILACKEEGITTIDIQHGMQIGNNPAYSRFDYLPCDSYDLLPDIFLVRGASEKNNLEKWLKRGKVIVSGDVWLNYWKNNNNEIVLKYDGLIESWKRGSTKRVILYTLDYAPIPAYMKRVIKRTCLDYFWCIRLHPADLDNLHKRYAELENLGVSVEFEKSSRWPLHAWLRKVDIHITEYSGVVFEAEQFGVPSIITSAKESLLFSNIIENGRAILAINEREILKALDILKKWKYEVNNDKSFLDDIIQHK